MFYSIKVTDTEYQLIRPDGSVCAWYPRSDDVALDVASYYAVRDLQDAINNADTRS